MLVNLLNRLYIAVVNLLTYTLSLEQSLLVNLLNLESVKSDGKKSRKLIWFRSK